MMNLIFETLEVGIKLIVAVIIGLMLLRGLISWLNLNPFSWFAYNVRRITEPMVDPLRRNLFALQSRRDIAPVLLVLFVLIVAYFLLGLLDQARRTIGYALIGLNALAVGEPWQGFRYLLGGLALGIIAFVITCIILQVLFSWVGFYGNWLSRLVIRVSEPVLNPFRRMIPPLGVLDISPIVAIFALYLLSAAVTAVLLS
jgi:YggT family protein